MVRKSKDEVKKALLEKKAQLEQRLKAIEAKENVQKRKDDARRKIIVGGLCLHHAAEKPDFKKWLAENLEKTLTRPDDRALFSDLLAVK
jgi:exonuclease III